MLVIIIFVQRYTSGSAPEMRVPLETMNMQAVQVVHLHRRVGDAVVASTRNAV